MRKNLLICLPLFAATFAALADEMRMPEPASVEVARLPAPPASLPARGSKMKTVLQQYGVPDFKHPAAGGDTRKHPPITRWDYAGFSVFFERSKVIDAVVPSQPPPLHSTEGLQSQ